MKAAEWIDRVKQTRGWESDYRVANELGLARATISKYRTKASTLDDESAIKVAEALAMEPVIVILDQAAERTRSDATRDAITKALKRLTAAGLAAFAFLGGPGSPPPAVACEGQASSDCYVKSRRRKRRNGVQAITEVLACMAEGLIGPQLRTA